mmetsp:Transcript_106633/g.308522  ORF Transcript_106633/g.308522 Transcript_106633/m.308522 type:complete len:189 (+) Transcript_106633:280-846(+)
MTLILMPTTMDMKNARRTMVMTTHTERQKTTTIRMDMVMSTKRKTMATMSTHMSTRKIVNILTITMITTNILTGMARNVQRIMIMGTITIMKSTRKLTATNTLHLRMATCLPGRSGLLRRAMIPWLHPLEVIGTWNHHSAPQAAGQRRWKSKNLWYGIISGCPLKKAMLDILVNITLCRLCAGSFEAS